MIRHNGTEKPMGLPRHIAIIMDGNGRWASQRNLPRVMGHRQGVRSALNITEACAKKGVEALTMYSFSTENWKRSKEEVDALMMLLEENLRNGWEKMHANGICFNVIGRKNELPLSLQSEIDRVMNVTAGNAGMTLTLALNYGGRTEIVDAARALSRQVKDGKLLPEDIDESIFERNLNTAGLPELDLIIRTSGEMRLSNFLLWQAAYCELYVTDTLWPDFNAEELDKALAEFDKRDRRYGG
jgi:undecaprenyl diphosphate synthase